MAEMITTPEGKDHIVMDFSDFAWLVDTYLGMEARAWMEEYLSETYGSEEEIDALVDYYEKRLAAQRQAMEQIRKESETLACLIQEKDLNRPAISQAAGRIGCISYREVNRP